MAGEPREPEDWDDDSPTPKRPDDDSATESEMRPAGSLAAQPASTSRLLHAWSSDIAGTRR